MSESEMKNTRLHVPPLDAPQRLDTWLHAQRPELSRSRFKKLFEKGRVWLNGAASRPSAKVRGGETVEFLEEPPEPAQPVAEAIELDIVFEDAHLVVVNKPPGLVVHPAAGHASGTLVNALLHHCSQLSGIGGVRRPGILHRLDKDTSGLMVVAKSDAAHAGLSAQLAARELNRTYLALVMGEVIPPSGQIAAPIGRHPRERKRQAVVPDGRPAVTIYRTLGAAFGISLVECRLMTGRTHQIRVHFAHRGTPIVGDAIYGYRKNNLLERIPATEVSLRQTLAAIERQMLHSCRLSFIHPVTGSSMEFFRPPPPDFLSALEALAARFSNSAIMKNILAPDQATSHSRKSGIK